jgi:hypothetical protein
MAVEPRKLSPATRLQRPVAFSNVHGYSALVFKNLKPKGETTKVLRFVCFLSFWIVIALMIRLASRK